MNVIHNKKFTRFTKLKPLQLVKQKTSQKLLVTAASIATLVASGTEEQVAAGQAFRFYDAISADCDVSAASCELTQVKSEYTYNVETTDQTLSGTEANDRFVLPNSFGTTAFDDVEGTSFDGKEGNNSIDLSNVVSRVRLDLGEGEVDFADGDPGGRIGVKHFFNVIGGKANDVITGDDNANILLGNDGSDTIKGEGGDDYISGGDGYDTLFGGGGNDIIHGGELSDALVGGSGNDTMYGGGGNDSFEATGANVIYGGVGLDQLNMSRDATVEYTIDKTGVKINIVEKVGGVANGTSYELNSVEAIRIEQTGSTTPLYFEVKDIYSDLSTADQGLFDDEVDFQSWLGLDSGYNYEGL